MEPNNNQNTPYIMDVEAGTHAWCACGKTGNQPFCDGSHSGSGIRPEVVKIEEAKKVAWCGCRKTGTPPFCDGSHARL